MIITFADLQKATGYTKPAEIAAHLARQGVRYFIGKYNRPYTTEESLNNALVGYKKTQEERTKIEL